MRIERRERSEDGLATLLVIILLVMMTGFTLMNAMALSSLKREMKLIEKRQAAGRPMTNDKGANDHVKRGEQRNDENPNDHENRSVEELK